ncbi:MAG: thioredoxin-disulfide reductase [Deltaproteobacteria bacterium]|nr:thioredoxin-disulfide reductase [Deltaproteobacteria bacterium]MBW2113040.1 thioredoxin-disulfide reductase [Deltaproteobacteria bacterium]
MTETNNKSPEFHDLVIIGAGPAGLAAGIYAARDKQDVVLLEKLSPGGQVLTTDLVENYPGFADGISGFELMDSIRRQAERFGLNILSGEVKGVDFKGGRRRLILASGSMEARAVIVATGAQPRKLGVEGEELLTGRGVSYCATCDGPFYRDVEVAVIGGGDTAVQEAVFLTRFASRVYVIHRRDELRATKIIQERAFANDKIEVIWNTIPLSVEGDQGVEGLRLKNLKTGKESDLKVDGVFVLVGTSPVTGFLKDSVDLDGQGFINVDRRQETSVKGVFAAGDVTSETPRQIATAVGEGVTAILSAEGYLEAEEG